MYGAVMPAPPRKAPSLAQLFSIDIMVLPLIQKCLPAFPCSCCNHSASSCCENCRKDPCLHDSPMNGQQVTCWWPLSSKPRAQHHVRPSSWNHSRARTHTTHQLFLPFFFGDEGLPTSCSSLALFGEMRLTKFQLFLLRS